ncbi:hypothetical protein KUCAC02_037546 [Chaenocephalus aceratus]|nr:hypothetical protein KUCAC02_037546 [Chaenocephalus aceratus]
MLYQTPKEFKRNGPETPDAQAASISRPTPRLGFQKRERKRVLDAAFEENDPVKCQSEKQAMLVDPHPVATSSSTSSLEVEPSTDVGHADARPFPQLPETPKTTQITGAPISDPTRRGRPKQLVHTRAKSIQCESVPLPPLTLLRPFGGSTVEEHIGAEETEFPMVMEEVMTVT